MPIEETDLLANARPMALAELVDGLTGGSSVAVPDTMVSGIEYDSRKVKPGDLFVALVGGYFDGHAFAAQAKERGAVALLVERPVDVDLPQVVVGDTRAMLAVVAARFYRHPSRALRVIGVTGTDGKTTTTYLIEAIFKHAGLKTAVMGTVAVRIGDRVVDADTRQTTPESLDVQRHLRAMADERVDVGILEATSHGLDLHRLDQTRFTTAAVTSITHEHLEHHKTVRAYRRAKARLFEAVSAAGGTAVINLDDEGAREMIPYARGARTIGYSLERRDAELTATDIQLSVGGTRFSLTVGDQCVPVETPMVGRFNVANALAAAGVALAHDISLEIIAKALAQAPHVPGRMQAIRRGQPFSVIVDYAHTPDSIEKVLSLLRSLNPDGRVILVMGSAGERDREKRPLQGRVAARLAHYSVFTTEDPRFEDADAIIAEIAAGARSAGASEGEDFVQITDRRAAIEHALRTARPGDCVLLAGKGHERSIIWGLEKRPWDEAGVAMEILTTLGYGEVPK